ncbi:DUF4382 domain-containing protein [Flavobacterium luminosum]|uniref:DUF4382 domain-containing protein n=1 Tax=Flavobacterium luminosum TaxID=2949086 RepID=A0ABT0TMH4_9FLAO|nr:DUF4382 domain-containing protein [Flavobacterium sp. HXWNR70]MCL9808289.1 DUF4382 domain-containing protein [Flavobacterium sp. HXWNR70]
MKNNVRLLSLLLMVFTTLSFQSCNDNDDTEKTATINVRMTDAPGDYDAVYVEVLDVMIKSDANPDETGWVSIGTAAPQVYNLLDLTGGVSALLASDAVIPSGHLGQIRLVLGDDNSVVKDGVTYPLKTPSAQQSGLKLLVNKNLEAGYTYDFLLDFDVEKSVVVQAGSSDNFNLNPVIRVSTVANSGIIKGIVTTTPPGVQVLASVKVNEEVVSAYTDAEGKFQINGIPAGAYSVTLTPDATSGLQPKIIDNVIVQNGQVTDLGNQSL